MSEEPNAEKLAKVYIKIRDRRRELEKEDKELKEQIDTIEAQLLEICKEQGASTIRTQFGTVSKRISKHYWTSDWDAFNTFILEHKVPHLYQQRISNSVMAQFLEENPDLHPPGLNADVKQTIVITKNRS